MRDGELMAWTREFAAPIELRNEVSRLRFLLCASPADALKVDRNLMCYCSARLQAACAWRKNEPGERASWLRLAAGALKEAGFPFQDRPDEHLDPFGPGSALADPVASAEWRRCQQYLLGRIGWLGDARQLARLAEYCSAIARHHDCETYLKRVDIPLADRLEKTAERAHHAARLAMFVLDLGLDGSDAH